jgi:alpha-glucosidase
MCKPILNLSLMLVVLAALPLCAESLVNTSPDGNIRFIINDDNGVPTYSVHYRGQEIIKPSRLGLEFNGVDGFVRNLRIVSHTNSTNDSYWEQPWGEQRIMHDHHNELLVVFTDIASGKKTLKLRVRVFDDGVLPIIKISK